MARVVLFVLCIAAVRALYEDQIGSFDWYRQFVGRVDYVALDGATAQGCKRILVASRSGVVASIDTETGDLAWRHVYESDGGVIDAVLRSKWGLITVLRGGQLLRSWDVLSGALRWETLTGLNSEAGRVDYPLTAQWRPGSVVATLSGTSLETLIVAVGSEVAGFKGRSGDRVWKTELELDSSDATVSYVHSVDQTIHILSSLEKQKLYIHRLDASNGSVQKKVGLPALWMKTGSTNTSSCSMVGDVALCLDVENQNLYHGSGERFLLSRLETLGIGGVSLLEANEDNDGFWVHSDHTHWLLRIQDSSVVVTTKTSDPLLLTVDLEKESVRVGVRWESGEEGSWVQVVMGEMEEEEELSGRVRLSEPRGRIEQGDIYLTRSKSQSVQFQLILLMEDSSIVMIHSPGDVRWVREDGLGAVVAMEAVDLPPADQSGSIANFITSTKNEGNPLKLALMRLQLQLSLTKEFVRNLQSRGFPTLLTSSEDLLRDQFSIRKLLVVATETGKLYGIDSSTGAIVWQRLVPNIAPLKDGTFMLRLLRTTSHPPLQPLCVLIGVSTATSACDGLAVYPFNPLSGDHMSLSDVTFGDSHMTCLGAVKQVLVLPHLDHTHSHVLLYMTQDMEIHTLPSSPQVTRHTVTLPQQLFLYAADVESGLLTGYHLEPDQSQMLTVREAWQLSYPTEFEHIVTIVTKSKSEHISSPGRVRADRSIQYKYLNPHLFAVVTQGYDDTPQEKSFFSVYLVDGVTGATIHHTTHKNAATPVNFVISENWIVYHYYNTKLRRYELAVTELYESPTNHTHSVWSSLSPPVPPVVTSQAYTFPSSVAAMTTTQTMKGLTYKSILVGLHSGHILSLPKRLLDPRRDFIATNDMREDGLPIYSPELVVKPVMYINYNRTIGNLKRIYVTASGLESTCLVLACGLDLFFTRVTPSKQFDLLAEDFDYPLIAAVVLGLVVVTISLSYLSKRKSLQSLWK